MCRVSDDPDVTLSALRKSVKQDALKCDFTDIVAALISVDVSTVGGSIALRARQDAESPKKVGRFVASIDTALIVSAYDFWLRLKSVSISDRSRVGNGVSSVVCVPRVDSISR